jgi:uncharacterized protein (TIGR00369 family)
MNEIQDSPLIQAYIANNAFGRLLGMDFQITAPGKVSYAIGISAQHLATPLSAHGGVIATLMDGALGIAALSAVCLDGKIVSTLEMGLKFLAPAKPGDQLIAHGELISKGNRILVAEAKVYNQEGKLISTGSGTFNAYPMEKAGYFPRI